MFAQDDGHTQIVEILLAAGAKELDTEEIKEDSVAFTNGWRSEYSEDRFYYWNILSPETTQCWELAC